MDAIPNKHDVAGRWAQQRLERERAELADHASNPVDHGYELVKNDSGDWSSVLSIAGAGALMLTGPKSRLTHQLIGASMLAGGADTVVQATRWLSGKDDATFGSTVYAATGVLPGASILTLGLLKGGVHRNEVARLGILGANLAVIGFELVNKGPKMLAGEQDTSGQLAFWAALGGVAMSLRHIRGH